MTLPHTFTIDGITPEKYAAVNKALQLRGALTTATTGRTSTKDLTLSWVYDGVSKVDVTIEDLHSFAARLASDAMIENRIRQLLSAT